MSRSHTRANYRILGFALATGLLLATASPLGPTPARGDVTTITVTPKHDTFTSESSPNWNASGGKDLRSSNYPLIRSTIWLQFEVPGIPADATIEDATLTLTTRWSERPAVSLHEAPSGWDDSLTHNSAPPIGPEISSSDALQPQQTFDVRDQVKAADGVVAFAIPPSSTPETGYSVESSEAQNGPVLKLTWQVGPPEPPLATETLFGASVKADGRPWSKAVADSDAAYGRMDVVRVFYPGSPVSWPGPAGAVERPVVVSFKDSVKGIAAGTRDDVLRKWFSSAPRDRDIWWSLHHEPEDNIRSGEFTAQQYREAWQRASAIAREVDNPRLHATLILMNWTLSKGSGRNWRDYYPGEESIDVIAFDVYNPTSSKTYRDPELMLAGAREVSAETGKPFGIAEFGSLLVPGDRDGRQRAEWLRGVAREALDAGAVFVTYWDSWDESGSYRLTDEPSRQAWREIIAAD